MWYEPFLKVHFDIDIVCTAVRNLGSYVVWIHHTDSSKVGAQEHYPL